MTPDYNDRKDFRHLSGDNSQNSREIDILLRDRSELLSAYIDGEVTAAERKQVQQWLDTDPQMQCLYTRMAKLHQGIQSLPVPSATQPAEQLANKVFASIDRRRQKRNVAWGGAAIAALFIGALSTIVPGDRSPLRLAESPRPEAATQPLMVALNRPLVEIPKAAIAEPNQSVKPSTEVGNIDINLYEVPDETIEY